MADFHADGKRLWDTLHQLAEIGGTEAGGVARVALTDADRAGRDQSVRRGLLTGLGASTPHLGSLEPCPLEGEVGSGSRTRPVPIGQLQTRPRRAGKQGGH